MDTIIYGLITGIISGIISSLLVYWYTKKLESKYRAYHDLQAFVFTVLEKCDIYIPIDILKSIKKLDKNNKKIEKAVIDIIDYIYPENSENREYNKREKQLIDNIKIVMEELNKIKNKNIFKKNME